VVDHKVSATSRLFILIPDCLMCKGQTVKDPFRRGLSQAVVSQSVDLGQNNNPNTTPTKDYEKVRVVVYLHGVQRGCAEEGERGSTPTG